MPAAFPPPTLLSACGADWDSVVPIADRKGHDRRYSFDISKISAELGHAPAITLDEGLTGTVTWCRDNRAW